MASAGLIGACEGLKDETAATAGHDFRSRVEDRQRDAGLNKGSRGYPRSPEAPMSRGMNVLLRYRDGKR